MNKHQETFDCIIVRYAEIGLKGGNRPFFERMLIKNIVFALGEKNARVIGGFGKVVVWPKGDADISEMAEKIRNVFGVAHVSRALFFSFSGNNKRDAERVIEIASEKIGVCMQSRHAESFKVDARRSDKRFPLSSPEINTALGAILQKKTGMNVAMANPDLVVYVDANEKDVFVYFEKLSGFGGLPVGVSGKSLALISSGFDSPVAAFLTAKRGCNVDFVHFHSYPQTSMDSVENVKKLVSLLSRFTLFPSLYLVPFLEMQKEIVAHAPSDYFVLLYRRSMMRIASSFAKTAGAKALVTGESIGQVASQTLENIIVTNDAAGLPVLRPLCGFNKEEIISLSRKIGAYEISSRGAEDCCTLFVPKHPHTKAKLDDVLAVEKKIKKLAKLEKEAIEKAETRNYSTAL